MRTIGVLVTLCVLTVALPRTAHTQQSTTFRSDSVAIVALIKEVETANNAGDVERWTRLFAGDFVYMAPGAPAVVTRAELVEVARTGFRNKAEINITPQEIHVDGNWGFARNLVTGTVRLADSERVIQVDVKQLVIYRKQPDGEWRIARFSSNSNG